MHQLRLKIENEALLCCPICGSDLELQPSGVNCADPACAQVFPVVDGVPILINEARSIFSIDDFAQRRDTFFKSSGRTRTQQSLKQLLPQISRNLKARHNYRRLADLLLAGSDRPRVLIIGGSILGKGMEALASHAQLDLVETDVALGPRTMLVCDAHDLPFKDGSFDAAIAQAVMEHVADPYRCAEEIHRVLKDDGYVYAESPLVAPVHAGRYDFTRFTHLGHRRLFRRFEEIDSGVVCGPGTALASTYESFLLSFGRARYLRWSAKAFARLTAFWLKYLDPYLSEKPGALDAAAGCYFLGRKSRDVLSDRELIKQYRGAL